MSQKKQATQIIETIVKENMPQKSVEKALARYNFDVEGKIFVVAIGKAAWKMTKAAVDYLGNKIESGICITKYDHGFGDIEGIEICEAGHPTPDENTLAATKKAISLVENLTSEDLVLFLVSGGGSALFENLKEGVSLEDLQDTTKQLLASGADITEMNTIRKRLSTVKAGGFAKLVEPASVFAVILSDVLGDRLDFVASGPCTVDTSTVEDAQDIIKKYGLQLSDTVLQYMQEETVKELSNVTAVVTGSVRSLCESAADVAKKLGYRPYILTTTLNCEAREAGRFLASIAKDTTQDLTRFKRPCAIIAGGETVVKVTGTGKGGRNQELALASAEILSMADGVLLFSIGSDGTDGPTDAAGGMVTEKTMLELKNKGIKIQDVLANNDSYNALKAVDSLVMTGPTGTNVNDITVVLVK
ncbi:MAG: glycerate kinase [Defluviitaleaceae bacterium]|nr:glycerate kinase [Defluviitaleaceae bacterium]